MSTASLPVVSRSLSAAAPYPTDVAITNVYRRPTREQGVALEILAHSIEYLVDSRFGFADDQALALLKGASRSVFSDCPVVEPLMTRVRRRFHLC